MPYDDTMTRGQTAFNDERDYREDPEDDTHAEDLAFQMAGADIQISKFDSDKRKTADAKRSKLTRVTSAVIANQDKHGKMPLAARIYLHPAFENSALGLIVANAMWIGVDIDWNGREGSYLSPSFFAMGESVFCFLFLLELFIRICAYRRTEMFFYDPDMRKWNLFDLGLVFFMVMDTWVLAYVVKTDSQELQLLSTFRLIRLLRMTRMLRLVPELGMMVKSMVAAVRSVASTCVLAWGIMYIFAIMFTQWVKTYGSAGKCIGYKNEVCLEDYFGTIGLSFLALSQILVFDDTFEIIRPIFDEQVEMGGLLIIYILLVSFTVLNMLIGIICDIVSETTASEREKQLQKRIEEIFQNMDIDESGTLTRDEFETSAALEDLQNLGIEPHVVKNAFDILDVNRDGQLASHEFVRMIFKCLHPPHAEEILELEARVDKIADVVGLGRRAIAVLDKEHKPKKKLSLHGVDVGEKPGIVHEMASRSPWMASVEEAAEKAAAKHQAAKEAIAEKAADEAEYAGRLKSLGWKLGDVLLLAEGRSLGQTVTQAGARGSPDQKGQAGMLMLENHPGAEHANRHFLYNQDKGPAPAPPSAGLMTILRPAMRALDARLHALRAECKAANMKLAGNIQGDRGEDRVPRQSLQPLDDLISEVIERLKAASVSLRPPGSPPSLLPPANVRQRDMVQLEDTSRPVQSRSASRDRQESTRVQDASRHAPLPMPSYDRNAFPAFSPIADRDDVGSSNGSI